MYKLDELEIQNLQDCWSTMYITIASSIVDIFGSSAEGVLRESVRRYGYDIGETNRKMHMNNNIKINLKNLFNLGCECHKDPRFRENILQSDEQVHLLDVITCPMANIWISCGHKNLGRIYCEEFYRSYYKSYCFDKAQVNLSKMLTHDGDNHCQFAIYFRPANLSKELRPKCFMEFDSNYEQYKKVDFESLNPKGIFKLLWLKMYYYLLEVVEENYYDEGKAAISIALQKLAVYSTEFIKKRADMTGKVADMDFISKNYPIDVEMNCDSFWNIYDKHDAKKILTINFNRLFSAKLIP